MKYPQCFLISVFAVLLTGFTASPFLSGVLSRAECGGQVLFFSDFEASDGGLTGTLDWEWGAYAWKGIGDCEDTIAPPSAAHSGTNMWGTVLYGCYSALGNNEGYSGCSNTVPSNDSILSFTVDLTGTSRAYLSWWEWFDLFMAWDWAEVYVNGEVVFQHCGGSYVAPTAWERQVVDISSHTGGMATIEFHMMASSVVNYSGWYLDDIGVTLQRAKPPVAPYLLLDE